MKRAVLLMAISIAVRGEDLSAVLGKYETSLYEAWKNKTVQPFEQLLAEDAIAYTPYGTFDRATQLQQQKGASSACEVRSFQFSNLKARSIANDAAILTYRVEQDAVCGGQKVPSPLMNTTVYAKRGGQWKIVFRTSQPAPSTANH